jgi:SAM-dependent methyltransferase
MKAKRALAYPLAVSSEVPLRGRVKECVELLQRGGKVLDVGCSSGWLSEHALNTGFTTYVGIDRAIVGAERAPAGMAFVTGSALELPFHDESFDAVCLFDVVEHLPRGSESRALSEVRRVLRSGGKLYFSTPSASPVHTLLDPVWCLGHRHYRRITIRRLLQSGGFAIDRLFVAGGVVECLDHIRLLVYKHVIRRPLPSIKFVNRLIDRAHGHDMRMGMTIFAVAFRRESDR